MPNGTTNNLPKVIDLPIDLDTPRDTFDLSKALKLRLINNLSIREIAEKLNTPKSTVHLRLQSLINLIGDPQVTEAYKEKRTEILNNVERVMINNLMDDDKLKAASLNNLAYAYGQIHTSRRLEEDKATSIIKPLVSFAPREPAVSSTTD